MTKWSDLPSKTSLETTAKNLVAHGFNVIEVADGQSAKAKVLEILPKTAEVMTMTSLTLDQTGIAEAISESTSFDLVKSKLMALDRATQAREMQRLGAAPEWSIGSVHAVTEDGKVLVASATGSQLPGYAYGSDHVIWVVGVQKIVKDLAAGMKRIEEYVLPLESERAHLAYGVPGSSINKLLIFNQEAPGRITIILVNQALGF